ncbi:MAG: ubiquinol-cytochrome C chaperone family protein [Hoeflea sp.]|uniref:ubiquinol-cytochrome C chaperone family protein n=1 Tax=Hoeflea sp. TaxID=1940281 RepID=UPI0032F0432F
MIWSLLKRKKSNQALVVRQYETITGAARSPVFYDGMGVPDTVMGRFEMIAIHLVLYLRRTASAGEAVQGLAQEVLEAFFEDVDHSIRELGIGDMGVPKRMKKFARMFYGRANSYGQALEARDRQALAAALSRNIHPEAGSDAPSSDALADWMLMASEELANVGEETLAQGRLVFPKAGE